MIRNNLHNRLVVLWLHPTRERFRNFYKTLGLFNDKDDAQNLIKFGAYLIDKGNRQASKTRPFDPEEGLKYWVPYMEGDILFHVGVEYFLKGVFLYKGYSINLPIKGSQLIVPYKINGNKSKLNAGNTHTLDYFIANIDKIVDFSDFDLKQGQKNQIKIGPKPKGLISATFKHPSHDALLLYLKFNRDSYVHSRRRLPEFVGIRRDVLELLDHIGLRVCNQRVKELADLSKISI